MERKGRSLQTRQEKRNRFNYEKELTRNEYNLRLSKLKVSLPVMMWELAGGSK